MSYDFIAQIIGELELGFPKSSHTCCTTFARQSRNIRDTFAWCSHNEIENIYHQQPSHDVLANVVRLSLEGHIIVARWFCDKMIDSEKKQHSSNLLTLRLQVGWYCFSLSRLWFSSFFFSADSETVKAPQISSSEATKHGRILLVGFQV